MIKVTHRLWYCKADKASGKPIIIQDVEAGTDTRRSASKFKVRKVFPAAGVDLQ